jgi:ATP-dependent Lhr-like helicase
VSPFERLHPAVRYHIVNTLGWADLRPTQRDAIEPIHSGENVLLLAPTAGGKTEAATLPILSRASTEGWTRLSVLYLCPLKALLNNLEPRLARYAGFVGRRAAVLGCGRSASSAGVISATSSSASVAPCC